MKDQQPKSIISIDYQHQLPKQIRDQLRQRMVLIQAQWLTSTNAISHRVNCSTGFLISSNLILTAAHNIFNKTTQRFADRLQLYFLHQQQGQTISIFSEKMVMNLTEDDYRCEVVVKNGKTTYGQDFAVVKIAQRQGKINGDGYLQFQNSGEIEKTTNIYLSGFPDFSLKQSKKFKEKKKEQIKSETFSCLKEDCGPLQKLQNNALYYHIVTIGGQSGSPLFARDTTKEGLRLIGVHNSYNSQKQMGKGVFFNQQNLATLQRWIDELSDQINEDRITRMVGSELKYFSQYSNQLAKKLDGLITNNSSLLGNRFRQTQANWQSFWLQLQAFKKQMQSIYRLSSQFYTVQENSQIIDSFSQNSSIRFQGGTWLQQYLQQKQTMNEDGQRCTGHRREPAYYFSEDIDSPICNRCVFFKKAQEVRCLMHGEGISFVEIDGQSGNVAILKERQIYLCPACMKARKCNDQPNLKYQRIDSHYRPISYLKFISSEGISNPSQLHIKELLLSDQCAVKIKNQRGLAVEKYIANELLDRNIIEIKQEEFERFMFKEGQKNTVVEKYVTEIQAKLAQYALDQHKQHNLYLQKVTTYFQAFSDALHCRSKQLKQQLLDHRTDDLQCLKILQKISIMKLHCFNQQTPTKLLTFLGQCITDIDQNITRIAQIKSQVILRLDKDIQSFIFHGGTQNP